MTLEVCFKKLRGVPDSGYILVDYYRGDDGAESDHSDFRIFMAAG